MKSMRFSCTPCVLVCGLLAATLGKAVSFPITGRPHSLNPSSLSKRGVNIGAFGNGSELVTSDADTAYLANLTLGGQEFQVLIDTGSSDLWVTGDVPGSKNLSIEAGVSYAGGAAQGFINTADLDFDDFTVKDQAYISVVPNSDTPDVQGLVGLGPSALSQILKLVKNTSGAPPLDRIFNQNISTPNFLSVLLSRQEDNLVGGSSAQTGQLTIGSIIPTLEDITNRTKLPALKDQFGVQHWQTLLDPNGIIGPDGNNIPTNTSIPNPDEGTAQQFHVVFDTGFTYPQVPREVADAIYGRVPGASFVTQKDSPGYWRVPCTYELNVTFEFAGVKYPISPLDVVMPETTDNSGKPITCMAAFQQISPSVANHQAFGAFDAILGMAFLRNTYLLIDFGDFVDGSNSSVADPYIQLLSVTDPASAHIDFVNARLGGVDTTGSQAPLVSEADAQHSPETPDDDTTDTNSIKSDYDSVKDDIKQFYKEPWFIAAASVAGALILGLFPLCIFCRRRTRRSKIRMEPAFTPVMAGANAYAPLRDSVVSQPRPGHYTQPSYDARAYQYNAHSGATYPEPRYNYGGRGV